VEIEALDDEDPDKEESVVSEVIEEEDEETSTRALEGDAELEDELEELLEEERETDELLEDEVLEDSREDALLALKSSFAKDCLKARALAASSSRVIKGFSTPFISPVLSLKDNHPNSVSLRVFGS
jgi:hypothetical protein